MGIMCKILPLLLFVFSVMIRLTGIGLILALNITGFCCKTWHETAFFSWEQGSSIHVCNYTYVFIYYYDICRFRYVMQEVCLSLLSCPIAR